MGKVRIERQAGLFMLIMTLLVCSGSIKGMTDWVGNENAVSSINYRSSTNGNRFTVWYPGDKKAVDIYSETPYPLIIILPGTESKEYTSFSANLARQGYIVCMFPYPYNTSAGYKNTMAKNRAIAANQMISTMLALNLKASSLFYGVIDKNAVGICAQGLDGYAAEIVCGAATEQKYVDKRIKAGFLLSPDNSQFKTNVNKKIEAPVFFMLDAQTTRAIDRDVYVNCAATPKYLAVIAPTASLSQKTNLRLLYGKGFFDRYLKEALGAEEVLTQRDPQFAAYEYAIDADTPVMAIEEENSDENDDLQADSAPATTAANPINSLFGGLTGSGSTGGLGSLLGGLTGSSSPGSGLVSNSNSTNPIGMLGGLLGGNSNSSITNLLRGSVGGATGSGSTSSQTQATNNTTSFSTGNNDDQTNMVDPKTIRLPLALVAAPGLHAELTKGTPHVFDGIATALQNDNFNSSSEVISFNDIAARQFLGIDDPNFTTIGNLDAYIPGKTHIQYDEKNGIAGIYYIAPKSSSLLNSSVAPDGFLTTAYGSCIVYIYCNPITGVYIQIDLYPGIFGQIVRLTGMVPTMSNRSGNSTDGLSNLFGGSTDSIKK